MQMEGEQLVAAPRQKVWEALNDPEVLRRSIPGCQSLERDGENGFAAVAEVKIGPIGARFKGSVQLSELDPPNGYRIAGSGQGGIAGSAKGGARVRLSDAPGGGTLVAYTVEAEVGGRMAQLGGPIIDATAKNLAGKFFASFGEVVAGGPTPAPIEVPAATAPAMTGVPVAAVPAPASQPAPLWGWVAALVVVLFAGFAIGQMGMLGSILLVQALALIVVAAAAYSAGRRA
jgi:carbon monoxide dehydrogenase subunit G